MIIKLSVLFEYIAKQLLLILFKISILIKVKFFDDKKIKYSILTYLN